MSDPLPWACQVPGHEHSLAHGPDCLPGHRFPATDDTVSDATAVFEATEAFEALQRSYLAAVAADRPMIEPDGPASGGRATGRRYRRRAEWRDRFATFERCAISVAVVLLCTTLVGVLLVIAWRIWTREYLGAEVLL